ncbi:MAG: efflux RND transporter periplasmic adaptor subunit [Planctomycetota bacterium]
MKKIIFLAICYGFLIINVNGCKKQSSVNNQSRFSGTKEPVRVTQAIKQDLSEIVTLTGYVKENNAAEIFPKVSGRVEKLTVDKGSEVITGTLLAELEHSLLTSQVKQFAASLESAELQLKQVEINRRNLEKDRERIVSLAEAGAVSQQKKDEIETRCEAMKEQRNQVLAQIKSASGGLEQAELQLKEAVLVAPVDGIIAERYLEIGDLATPTKPVFKIVRMQEVKIIGYLPEQYSNRVNINTPASINIDAYPENNFSGLVNRIAPTLDPKTRSAEIEIKLANQDYKLKPGMSARLELILATHRDVLVLPKDYIISEIDKNIVLLVKDNKIKKQVVNIGIQSRGLAEITEGVTAEDIVITTVGAHLKEGTEVEIVK